MTRRFLFLGLAAAVMALGGMSARADSVSLASLLTPGAKLDVGNLEFSNFTYTPTPSSATPVASDVTVNPLSNGIQFAGGFFADAGTRVDYAFTYTVKALSGTISGADVLIAGGLFNGTGTANLGDTITWSTPGGGTASATLDATLPSKPIDSVTFPAQTTLQVAKDLILVGRSDPATVSIVNQTFGGGSAVIPEPTSMGLLGIGLSGLFTFRRFLKRALVA